jgi:hypothetical protein
VRYSINGHSIEYKITNFEPHCDAVTVWAGTRISVPHRDQITGEFQRIKDYPQINETRTFEDIIQAYVEDLVDAWENIGKNLNEKSREAFVKAACDSLRVLIG